MKKEEQITSAHERLGEEGSWKFNNVLLLDCGFTKMNQPYSQSLGTLTMRLSSRNYFRDPLKVAALAPNYCIRIRAGNGISDLDGFSVPEHCRFHQTRMHYFPPESVVVGFTDCMLLAIILCRQLQCIIFVHGGC